MKKLSIALVLAAGSVTLANAQTTDSAKKVQSESAVAELKADTNVVAPATEEAKMETKADVLQAEETTAKKEAPAEMKRKAKAEKKMEPAKLED
ncbi:hypothetical protein [Kaistella palustris]|uniref:hypothetical protein n=1 Tax=Kaistella palustris TaxID=493376 RepID=UPI000417FABA|nr:hypothetical protein [Kaistella palustris]